MKSVLLLCFLVYVFSDANHEESPTFIQRNTLIKGMAGGNKGQCFVGEVYRSGPASSLQDIQFHLDIRPKCQSPSQLNGFQRKQGERVPPTYCELNPISTEFTNTLTQLTVLLVRGESGFVPQCSNVAATLNSLAGTQVTPTSNPVPFIYNALTGPCGGASCYNPLYQYPSDVIWAKTFYPDDMSKVVGVDHSGVERYISNYISTEDATWKGLNLDEGDSIYFIVAGDSNWNTFSTYGGYQFNGHFNHRLDPRTEKNFVREEASKWHKK